MLTIRILNLRCKKLVALCFGLVGIVLISYGSFPSKSSEVVIEGDIRDDDVGSYKPKVRETEQAKSSTTKECEFFGTTHQLSEMILNFYWAGNQNLSS